MLFYQSDKTLANLWVAFSLSILLHFSLLLIPDRPAGGSIKGSARTQINAVLRGVTLAVVAETAGAEIHAEANAGTEFRDESNIGLVQSGSPPLSDSLGVPLIAPLLQPVLPETSNPVVPAVPESTSYFRRSDLTVAPVMQDEPLIEVSENMGRIQKGGKLALRLYISNAGTIDRIEVVSSNLPNDTEEIIKAAFTPLRFKPGEINGVTVSSQIVFEIDLDGPTKGASRSSDQAHWNAGSLISGKSDGTKGR